MATVTIRRVWQFANFFRAYRVLLDGQPVGVVRNNSEITIMAEPGQHLLQLKLDWCGSDFVPFSLAADQSVRFECGSASAFVAIFYVTLNPSRLLWLRPAS